MQIRTVIRNLKLRILSIFPVIQTKILYKKVFKRDLDLKVPKTFNEKIDIFFYHFASCCLQGKN